jgi:hypothetical protein
MNIEQNIPTKKVTMNLPLSLAENAPKYLGKSSLTEAVRDALREAMHRKACQELLAMRGKFDLQIDLVALRKDE